MTLSAQNKRDLRLLASAIRNEKIKIGRRSVTFGMPFWKTITQCGTWACVGGSAEILFKVKREAPSPDDPEALYPGAPTAPPSLEAKVGARLGLTKVQRDALFYPAAHNNRAWEATPRQAARVIRHLASTGKVRWTPEIMGKP
jgi:hypothetical protein